MTGKVVKLIWRFIGQTLASGNPVCVICCYGTFQLQPNLSHLMKYYQRRTEQNCNYKILFFALKVLQFSYSVSDG